MKNLFISRLRDEIEPIDNLASANWNWNFGEKPYSGLIFIYIVDLIIAL